MSPTWGGRGDALPGGPSRPLPAPASPPPSRSRGPSQRRGGGLAGGSGGAGARAGRPGYMREDVETLNSSLPPPLPEPMVPSDPLGFWRGGWSCGRRDARPSRPRRGKRRPRPRLHPARAWGRGRRHVTRVDARAGQSLLLPGGSCAQRLRLQVVDRILDVALLLTDSRKLGLDGLPLL